MNRSVEDTIKEIRLNIRRMRTKKRVSQGEMSRLSGVSRPFYNQIESGKRKLSLTRLIQISNVLGVGLSALTKVATIVVDEPKEEYPPPSLKPEDTDEPRRKGYTEESPRKPTVRCSNHAMWTYHTDPA